jgi:hypothetical protein
MPLYERLTDEELLQRCSRMKTQNANECFNGLIWGKCPKTESTSASTVQLATAMAVVEFNAGPRAFGRVLHHLGVKCGSHFLEATNKAQKKRLRKAAYSASPAIHQKRKRAKFDKSLKEESKKQAEGKTYEAAAFNF